MLKLQKCNPIILINLFQDLNLNSNPKTKKTKSKKNKKIAKTKINFLRNQEVLLTKILLLSLSFNYLTIPQIIPKSIFI